jgi:hypothetical protein
MTKNISKTAHNAPLGPEKTPKTASRISASTSKQTFLHSVASAHLLHHALDRH